MQDLIGRSLRDGEYVILEPLGSGGQASVFRARSTSLETDVAIKVLAPQLAANLALRERFHDEARLLSQLHHPNLVTVHYFGEEGELVYIAMRLVNGGTLRDRLQAVGGTFDLVTAARYVRDVASALQAAHDADIVHLDVKPSNVLLGRADWPLLADTGIAEFIQPRIAPGGRRIVGTPAYMSPEQCRGDAVDGRSDQYSLAIMAYQLLTGQVPFEGPTTQDVMRRQVEDTPRRPREFNPGLPSPVEDILLRALAKDPTQRFPTIAEFGDALADTAERTRGMSLDVKTSVADAAPNLIGTLALLALGPALLAMVPGEATLLGGLPLRWPFQVLLGLAVSALLLGVRWHVVGLAVHAARTLAAAIDRARGRTVQRDTRLRQALIGSAEGVVNLVYLLGLYRLLAIPILALLGAVLDVSTHRVLGLVVAGVLVLAALAFVLRSYRSSGFAAALIVFGVGWAFAAALPMPQGVANGATIVRLLVGVGLLAVLVVRRRATAELVGGALQHSLGRLLVESRPGATAQQIEGSRKAIFAATSGALDLAYLLVGYAMLRTPLIEELEPLTSPLVAAILVTGLAGLVWAILAVRLNWAAGLAGLVLAVAMGAPLVASLPIFDPRAIGVEWPAAIATWLVGIAFLLVLVVLRGRIQAIGQPALGARLDRGLMGTTNAPDEVLNERRQSAFGRLAGALIDVGYLVAAYWLIGVPAVQALVKATGQPLIGTAAIAALLAAVLGVLLVAMLRARPVLAATGGPAWQTRARALGVVPLALLALFITGGAATPVALAAPLAAGGLELQQVQSATLVVDRDFWVPLTPLADQATYQLALSCSDGRQIGQFRESIRPSAGMPAGQVGPLGKTTTPCDNWPAEYGARRQAAGLGDSPSLSWAWLDVRADLNADASLDVLETHRVLFTAGRHSTLAVPIGVGEAPISQMTVTENDTALPETRTWVQDGQRWIGWGVPEVSAPAERTYAVRYQLAEALKPLGDDRQALAWSVGAPAALEPIWLATVQLRLPHSVDPNTLRLTTTGVPARQGLVGDRTAWFAASSAVADQPLGVQLDFPVTRLAQLIPTPSPTPPPPTSTPTSTSTPAPTLTLTPTVSPTSSPAPTSTPDEIVAVVPDATPDPPTPPPTVTAPTTTPTLAPPTPTETPSEPSPEPSPEPTVAAVDTPEVATAIPTPTNTPAPPTPTPTIISTPLPECPEISGVSLTPNPRTDSVALTWSATGGCAPYKGTITARRAGASSTYASYPIDALTGALTDTPPSGCERISLDYALELTDARNHTARAVASLPFTQDPPEFNSARLSVTANADGTVKVDWSSSGGCPAYRGTITVQAPTGAAPRTLQINGAQGSLTDQPTPGGACGPAQTLQYTLRLTDDAGQTLRASDDVTVSPQPPPFKVTLTARPNSDGVVLLNWDLSGGCPPFTGAITVQHAGTTRQIPVTSTTSAGSVSDRPPIEHCESPITYTINLTDAVGQKASDSTAIDVPLVVALNNPTLTLTLDSVVHAAWSFQGGCSPFTGSIAATYSWGGTDSRPVTTPQGVWDDGNVSKCPSSGGLATYRLTVTDSRKQTVSTSSEIRCGVIIT